MAMNVKERGEKSEITANVFRHEKEELGLAPICITLLAVFIGIYFINFVSIMISVSVLIAKIFVVDSICKAASYELRMEGNSLIYMGNKGKWCNIHLPCLVIQKRKGMSTRIGNKVEKWKISIANRLEFNASDTDQNGRTILEFLEEVNVRCMLLD